jgi:hypothetical protein
MTLADQAVMSGHDGQVSSSKPERPKRRTFTAAYKARILAEVSRHLPGHIEGTSAGDMPGNDENCRDLSRSQTAFRRHHSRSGTPRPKSPPTGNSSTGVPYRDPASWAHADTVFPDPEVAEPCCACVVTGANDTPLFVPGRWRTVLSSSSKTHLGQAGFGAAWSLFLREAMEPEVAKDAEFGAVVCGFVQGMES